MKRTSKNKDTPSPASGEGDLFSRTNIETLRAKIREYLRQHGHDAETFPGLAKDKAPDGLKFRRLFETVKPVNAGDNEMYFCPFCRHKNKFWSGWFILGDDEKVRLIGNRCAARHLGAQDWSRSRVEYDEMRQTTFYEMMTKQLIPACLSVIEELRNEHGNALEVTRCQNAFDTSIPYIADAARSGPLNVERQVRDVKRMMRLKKDDKRVLDRPETYELHTLRGGRFLDRTTNPVRLLGHAREALEKQYQAVRPLDATQMSGQKFNKISRDFLRACGEAIRDVETAQSIYIATMVFFESDNIRGLCRWANDVDNPLNRIAKFTPVQRGIRMEPFDADTVEVSLPSGLAIPSFPTVAKLKHLLDKGYG